MNRFLIFDPRSNSYVKMYKGGWTSGHTAEEVNSYGSLAEALEDKRLFESLSKCQVIEVVKTVQVVGIVT